MICAQCGKGDLVPTLVPRIAGGFARIAYVAAMSGVLILGATVGLGLAVMGEGGVDWGRALVVVPMTLIACCQWQLKTAHFWQLKTAHFGERAVGRSGRSPGDAHRACWAGRRERSDRRPGQHAPRRCGAGGHVATPSRCSSDAVLSQC